VHLTRKNIVLSISTLGIASIAARRRRELARKVLEIIASQQANDQGLLSFREQKTLGKAERLIRRRVDGVRWPDIRMALENFRFTSYHMLKIPCREHLHDGIEEVKAILKRTVERGS
jgi:hypothetical protein